MGRLFFFVAVPLAVLAASCADESGTLHEAARKGELEEVRRFLADDSDINRQDGGGFTSLHMSIMGGHAGVTRYLIDEGADVNVAAIYGVMPLHVATDVETVRLLVERGARVDAWSKTRGTPLHAAVNANSTDAVRLLLESGAPPDAGDVNGSTALHYAAGKGRATAVALLVASGADVDIVNDWGFTPLHWAAGNGHVGVAARLIESGASRKVKSYSGLTPRDLARAKGHGDLARMLEAEDMDSS